MLSGNIVRAFYILDNFKEVIVDTKFFFCMLLICTFCSFLEIFVNKIPILYGIITDGKNLPPYKREKDKKIKIKEEINNEHELSECK